MEYYRVKRNCDRKAHLKTKKGVAYNAIPLVKGRLFTRAEYERLIAPPSAFETVQIKRYATHYIFGMRFEI